MQLDKTYNEHIIKSKLIPIKAFHNICIGDPMYFENQEGLDLTINTKLNSVKSGFVLISEVAATIEDFDCNSIIMNVMLSPEKIYESKSIELASLYFDNKHYKGTVKKDIDLACDTASFEIDIDGNYDHINTGADGYYGYASVLKQYYGFSMELSFDGDLFSFEDIVNKAEYLFKEDKSKMAQIATEQLEQMLKRKGLYIDNKEVVIENNLDTERE